MSHPPTDFQEIAPGVWAVLTQFDGGSFEGWLGEGFAPNSGFVVGDDGVLVIDPRMFKRQAEEVAAKVAQVAGRPVRHVVNTHWHNDHVFGNEGFGGATIIAGRKTFEALAFLATVDIVQVWADDPIFAPVADQIRAVNLILPHVAFEGELVLRVGGRRVVLRSLGGGETADTIVAYLPEEKILFASDLVLNGTPPYFGDPTVSVNDWIASLEAVERMAPRVIVPGHGPLAGLDDVRRMADDLRDYRRQVIELARERLTPQQIKERVRLRDYPGYPWFPREALLSGVDVIYKELKR
ncbi:MAG: MBL fold metallo-hydrolase [Planctomycetota bacterium]